MVLIFFSQFVLAESLFAKGYYNLASVEYQRLFFFDTSAYRNFQLRLNYTIAVLKQDIFRGYGEIEKLFSDFPKIDTESKVILGRELYKMGNYDIALNILNSTPEKRLVAFSYLFNGQYFNALKEFQSLDEILVQEINDFINRPKKSVTKAMLFSAGLPGAGEIYADNVKQGVQDFLLTFLSGFLLYNSIKNKKYVDAGIIFSLVFNRFYFGSISNAGRTAQITNEKLEAQWLDYIKNRYSIQQ